MSTKKTENPDEVFEATIYEKLTAPFPPEAIERASKEVTRKGYDTTGYQYQYLVERLNIVLGLDGWGMSWKVVKEIGGEWSTGRKFWEITTKVAIWLQINDKKCVRTCAGGHKSEMHADALKGSITNGIKKTLALFDVGGDAYKGILDEDYRAAEADSHPTAKTIPDKPVAFPDVTNPAINPFEKEKPPTHPKSEKPKKGEPLPEAHQKLWGFLGDFCYLDKDLMRDVLKEITGFEGKDGKWIDGKDSIYDLSEKWAWSAYGKLKKKVEDKEGEGVEAEGEVY